MNDAMDPSEEQFFQQGEEQSEEHGEEAPPEPLEPPEELEATDEQFLANLGIGVHASARRARLKRVVGAALIASAGLFGVGLVRHFGLPHWKFGVHTPARQATLSAALAAKPTPGAASPALSNTLTTDVVTSPGSTLADSSLASGRGTGVDAEALIRNARTLLEGGHTRDGVAAARVALNADPRNAEPYILLAAGLQDLGRWAEAQSVFTTCKEATSSGPNATCRYFAGVRN